MIRKNKTIRPGDSQMNELRLAPLALPEGFEWCDLDINRPIDLLNLYTFLNNHYVSDDTLRFNYSQEFLYWALSPPGYKKQWHIVVRSSNIRQTIIGFISAIPVNIIVNNKSYPMVEINFLCVHTNARNHRLAPVLIAEITRRVNIDGIYHGLYTGGIKFDNLITTSNYYLRPINHRKLLDIKFLYLSRNQTLNKHIKHYHLPKLTSINLIKLEKNDIPEVFVRLKDYLKKFAVYHDFNLEDFDYWFLNNIIQCFVVKDQNGNVTDMVSYLVIQSTILNHNVHRILNVGYLWYYFSTKTPIALLLKNLLIIAQNNNVDVFNCLDIQDNMKFIDELRFNKGTGQLHYYIQNLQLKCNPSNIGIILV